MFQFTDKALNHLAFNQFQNMFDSHELDLIRDNDKKCCREWFQKIPFG